MSRELMSRLLVLETAAGECVHPQSAIDERRALAAAFESGARILSGIAAALRTEASEMAGSRHSYDEALEAYVDAAEDLEVDRDAAMEVVNRRMEALAAIVPTETKSSAPILVPAFELPPEVLDRMPGASPSSTTASASSDARADSAPAGNERPSRRTRTAATDPTQALEGSADAAAVADDATVDEPSSASGRPIDPEPSSAPSTQTTPDTQIAPEAELETVSGSEPVEDAGIPEEAVAETVEDSSADLFEVEAGAPSVPDDAEASAITIDAEASEIRPADPVATEVVEPVSETVEAVETAPEVVATPEPSVEPADADGSKAPETAQASATPVGARRPGRMPPFVKR